MGFLFLFDIDGTLLSTGGAGRTAMEWAIEEVLGVPSALQNTSLGGRVDSEIVGSILRRHLKRAEPVEEAGEPPTLMDTEYLELFEEICQRYTERLPDCLEASERIEVFDGVVETLEWLSQCEDVLLGIGTGNIQRGAFLKLDYCGLAKYFHVGGYGDDAVDRVGVLETGWQRALHLKPALEKPRDVLVIGDTSRDIRAARSAGMPVAVVLTGGETSHELAGHGPDLLWNTMSEGLHWMKNRFSF